MRWQQQLQAALAFFGGSVLTNLVWHHKMPWWLAVGIVVWALTVGTVAFFQGWEARR